MSPQTAVFSGNVVLEQSYSSWVALGNPENLCDSVNNDGVDDGKCTYEYNKDQHEVNKSITADLSEHQTGQ